MKKQVVTIVNDYLSENDVLLIEWHSKRSKKNKWVVNKEKKNVRDIESALQDYAIENEYMESIEMRDYDFVKDLLYQFTHKTYCQRNEKLMLKVMN